MSATLLELKLQLTGGASVTTGINQVYDALRKRLDDVKAFNKQIENGSAALNSVLQQAATVIGGRALLGMVGDAQQVTVAQVQLQQAMVSTGKYSKEAYDALLEQADALETLTGAGNETTLSIQRILLLDGATADQVKRLTPLILDVAAAMGTDGVSAALRLGAALDGQQITIGRYNITASNISQLITQLTGKFDGQAVKLQQAKGGMGEFTVATNQSKEAVGGFLQQPISEFLSSFVTSMKRSFTTMKDWLGLNSDVSQSITNIAGELGDIFGSKLVLSILAVVAALVAVKGVAMLLSPAVNILRSGFVLLTGQGFAAAFQGAKALVDVYSEVGNQSGVLSRAMQTVEGRSQLLAGAFGIVGAALAGWELGKVIGQLEVMGMTINDRVTFVILEAMRAWEQFKYSFGFINDNEFWTRNDAIDKSEDQIVNALKKKTPEPVNNTAEKDPTAAEKRLLESAQKLEIAKAEAAAKIHDAYADSALKKNEQQMQDEMDNFKAETMGLEAWGAEYDESYLQKRKDILEARFQTDREAIQTQLDILDQQIAKVPKGDKAGPADDTKRNELLAQREDLFAQLTAMDTQYDSQIDQLDADWLAKRKAREEEADQARVADAQQRAEQELQLAQRKLQKAEDDIALQRAKVQNDFTLTDEEKRQKEIELYDKEDKLIKDQIANLEKLKALQTDPAAAASIETQINSLQDKSRGLGTSEAGLMAQADPNSLSDQMGAVLAKLRAQVGTVAQGIANIFDSTIQGAINGISSSISGLLKGTMTWGQALQNIGTSILDGIIDGFARVAAGLIVQQIMVWATGSTLQAAALAASAPMAAASASLWATPAFLASVASYGTAAAAGGAAIASGAIANLGAMKALTIAGGFKSGGYTGDGDPNQVAGVTHFREVVFDEGAVNAIGKDRLERMRMTRSLPTAGIMSRQIVPVATQQAAAPIVNVTSAPAQVHFVPVADHEKLQQILESRILDGAIVNAVKRNKPAIGLRS